MADNTSMVHTPIFTNDIGTIRIENAFFDTMWATSDISIPLNEYIPDIWDDSTILLAKFEGNLFAGNVSDQYEDDAYSLIFKKRVAGEETWMSFMDMKADPNVSLNEELLFIDKYTKAGASYEYGIFIYYNDVLIDSPETNPSLMATATSDFCGTWIMDKDTSYFTEIEVDRNAIPYNSPSTIVTTLANRYPYVIKNGVLEYYSGTVSGVFADNDDCGYEFGRKAVPIRMALNKFLANGKSKVLKFDDGRTWIIGVNSAPSEAEHNHPDVIRTTFGWVEVGDIDTNKDLYYNGLIDYLAKDGE